MSNRMLWANLLNDDRRNKKEKKTDHRNEFEKDYDRIVASSSLRRLQDKAQVYPLQDNDFIRTRLTHSMEVSAIARSFGTWLEQWLINDKKELTTDDYRKIPNILAVAGLVHDIGNPPFGHYGEDVIKCWFAKWFSNKAEMKKVEEHPNYKIGITQEEINDFLHFDGNAQGIRILTSLQFLNNQYGINFTYATLSILMKYPWDSSHEVAVEKKKFGYFQKDKNIAEDIIKKTVGEEFMGKRNPLTYFLEASDDIAYLGADVEDSVKKGVIPWEKEFPNIIESLSPYYEESMKKLEKKYADAQELKFPDYCFTSAQNFKVWAQGQMIKECIDVFRDNYDDIMTGNFTGDLLNKTEKAKEIKKILKRLVSGYCYPNKEVLSLELVGDSVINDLLNTFVNAIIFTDIILEEDHKPREGKLFRMISDNFRFVYSLDEEGKSKKTMQSLSLYDKLLLITDFVSGMTDSYALDLHQKLKGVKMP
ncbi:dGTP triphosphohydrolase [Priestia sp. TGN 0903]|uniref:dGTP triphosphohydrolase n=1 Tax=Priestia sp. TGN 0903 TaxID=3420730 RepID=UPI003D7773BF